MSAVTGIVVRRARAGDAPGICAAHIASIRGVCSRDYSPEEIESWCFGKVPALYEPLIEQWAWYVGDAGGEIAGFGEVDVAAAPRAAEVKGLYIAPAWVGKGVGAAIIRRLLEDARGARVQRVFLKGTLTAEPFYRRMGFVQTGRGVHRSRGGLDLACVMMEMIL